MTTKAESQDIGYRAGERVNDEGLTRLEATELERKELVNAELNKHRDNADAELSRHRQALEHISNVFSQRLWLS